MPSPCIRTARTHMSEGEAEEIVGGRGQMNSHSSVPQYHVDPSPDVMVNGTLEEKSSIENGRSLNSPSVYVSVKDGGILQENCLNMLSESLSPLSSASVSDHTGTEPILSFGTLAKLHPADFPNNMNNDTDLIQRIGSELMQSMHDESSRSSLSPLSSPGFHDGDLTSPEEVFPDVHDTINHVDTTTQMTLIEKSSELKLEESLANVDSRTLWSIMSEDACDSREREGGSRKAFKSSATDDAHNSKAPLRSKGGTLMVDTEGFNMAGAVSSSQFIFQRFGKGVLSQSVLQVDSLSSTVSDGPLSSIDVTTSALDKATTVSNSEGVPVQSGPSVSSPTTPASKSKRTGRSKSPSRSSKCPEVTSSTGPPNKKMKEPSLNLQYSAKAGKMELKILVQPESQHRARYMTEGSRGAVKDQSQQGHPKIQLVGYDKPINLQVFVGTDTGKVKPHGFYQACKVSGKNSTPCIEKDIEGTTVIEIGLDPGEQMISSIDCVGILKLRNADVEQRIGLARSKKKSTRARLVFRVCIPKPDGTYQTLQVASTAISCTQPAGQPEICKKSLSQAPATGTEELFIIGKNFSKGTQVMFQEVQEDSIVWSQNVEIDQEYFQPTHLICAVPEYRDTGISQPVDIQIVVQSSGRVSEPHAFTYFPVVKEDIKVEAEDTGKEVAMETDQNTHKSSFVSPVALALNKMYEEASQATSSSQILPSLLAQEQKLASLAEITPAPTQAENIKSVATKLTDTASAHRPMVVAPTLEQLLSTPNSESHHKTPPTPPISALNFTSPNLAPEEPKPEVQFSSMSSSALPMNTQTNTSCAKLAFGSTATRAVNSTSMSNVNIFASNVPTTQKSNPASVHTITVPVNMEQLQSLLGQALLQNKVSSVGEGRQPHVFVVQSPVLQQQTNAQPRALPQVQVVQQFQGQPQIATSFHQNGLLLNITPEEKPPIQILPKQELPSINPLEELRQLQLQLKQKEQQISPQPQQQITKEKTVTSPVQAVASHIQVSSPLQEAKFTKAAMTELQELQELRQQVQQDHQRLRVQQFSNLSMAQEMKPETSSVNQVINMQSFQSNMKPEQSTPLPIIVVQQTSVPQVGHQQVSQFVQNIVQHPQNVGLQSQSVTQLQQSMQQPIFQTQLLLQPEQQQELIKQLTVHQTSQPQVNMQQQVIQQKLAQLIQQQQQQNIVQQQLAQQIVQQHLVQQQAVVQEKPKQQQPHDKQAQIMQAQHIQHSLLVQQDTAQQHCILKQQQQQVGQEQQQNIVQEKQLVQDQQVLLQHEQQVLKEQQNVKNQQQLLHQHQQQVVQGQAKQLFQDQKQQPNQQPIIIEEDHQMTQKQHMHQQQHLQQQQIAMSPEHQMVQKHQNNQQQRVQHIAVEQQKKFIQDHQIQQQQHIAVDQQQLMQNQQNQIAKQHQHVEEQHQMLPPQGDPQKNLVQEQKSQLLQQQKIQPQQMVQDDEMVPEKLVRQMSSSALSEQQQQFTQNQLQQVVLQHQQQIVQQQQMDQQMEQDPPQNTAEKSPAPEPSPSPTVQQSTQVFLQQAQQLAQQQKAALRKNSTEQHQMVPQQVKSNILLPEQFLSLPAELFCQQPADQTRLHNIQQVNQPEPMEQEQNEVQKTEYIQHLLQLQQQLMQGKQDVTFGIETTRSIPQQNQLGGALFTSQSVASNPVIFLQQSPQTGFVLQQAVQDVAQPGKEGMKLTSVQNGLNISSAIMMPNQENLQPMSASESKPMTTASTSLPAVFPASNATCVTTSMGTPSSNSQAQWGTSSASVAESTNMSVEETSFPNITLDDVDRLLNTSSS